MSKPMHLYLVFNPLINQDEVYLTQAHEFYSTLKNKYKRDLDQKNFLSWGKLLVNQSGSVSKEKINHIIKENGDNGFDTHLYITDYHHFWVGKLECVSDSIKSSDDTIPFYDDKDVEMWFKLTDMDLISSEFNETAFYLSQLYVNNPYFDKKIEGLTPYIGNLNFPLVVQDHNDESYFQRINLEDSLRILRNNPLVESPTFAGNIKKYMNSFVLPPHVFSKLSSDARNELLSAEMNFSQKENNHHYEDVLQSYIKILETVMNDTFGKLLKSEFGDCLYVSSNGRNLYDGPAENSKKINQFNGLISIDCFVTLLRDVKHFGNLSLDKLFLYHKEIVEYFVSDLVPFINDFELVALKESREETHKRELIFTIRNKILGVGCNGIINQIMTLSYQLDNLENDRKLS